MENAYLIDRLQEMMAKVRAAGPAEWGGNHDDLSKLDRRLTRELLDRFADYAIGGIGFEFGRDLPDRTLSKGSAEYPLVTLDEAEQAFFRSTIRGRMEETVRTMMSQPFASLDQVVDLLRVDGVVGGRSVAVKINDRKIGVSFHTLKTCSRAYAMRSVLGGWPSTLLEIGGGHGRFIRDIAICSRDCRLYYTDLPINLVFAARYLSRVCPGEVALIWSDQDAPDASARITLIAPWLLHRLPEGIEVCCNFDSFQHMEHRNLAYYTDVLVRRDVRSIFHINRSVAFHPGEVALADYPWTEAFLCEDEHIIDGVELRHAHSDGDAGPHRTVHAVRQYLVRR